MRQRWTAVPGASLRAITIPGGHIQGIAIDNPSGSWLFVSTLDTYIPPFMQGFGATLPYGASSIDIIAGNGPSGQLGTTAGDPIVVDLSDTPVAPSPGVPFVSRSEQPEWKTLAVIASPTNAADDQTTALLAGSLTKRLRIHRILVAASSNRLTHFLSIFIARNIAGLPVISNLELNPNKTVDRDILGEFDLALGEELRLTTFIVSPVVGDAETINIFIQYAIV